MGHSVTFDTLKFVETLKASGFDDIQAKGMATAIREVQETIFDDFAAKRDLKELEGQLSTKADVAKVDIHVLELKRDIKELETRIKELDVKMDYRFEEMDLRRMVIKVNGMILVGITILFSLMHIWPLPVQYVPPYSQETYQQAPVQPGK